MVRFLADANLHHAIVSGCSRREPAIDFLSAHAGRLEGPKHFGKFLEAHGSSPGVFLVKQSTPLAAVIEALVLVWAASDSEEWKNRIVEIPLR